MNKDNSIGIIITVYNKAQYIIRALKSLFNQKVSPEQLIIVDDCSTDNSVSLINDFIQNNEIDISTSFICLDKNVGAAQARNIAIERISTDYIVFLDADDQYESTYIERLKLIINNNPKTGMIASKVTMESTQYIYPSNKINALLDFEKDNFAIIKEPFKLLAIESLFVGGGNVCFKKSLITEWFDPNERNFEEWNFYYTIIKAAIIENHSIIFNNIPSYIYNDIDETSLSRKKIDSNKKIVLPALIKRIENKEETKYRSLLISIWFYNSIERLSGFSEKIKFISNNYKVIKDIACNRYMIGGILQLIIPYTIINTLKDLYKNKRFQE